MEAPRRVVVKVEYTAMDVLNVRFIVTNIKNTPRRELCERTYCGRGKDELYICELKESVNGVRLSCHRFTANKFRVMLYAAAYILLHSFLHY